MKFFDAAVALAKLYPEPVDDRPAKLRELRDAQHPTCVYYRFLHDLVDKWGPLDVIEIGTYVGTSAAHLALRNTGCGVDGYVITIDINPDAKRCVDELGIPNIRAITGDSHAIYHLSPTLALPTVDVLYVDGQHTFNRAWGEYGLYRQRVRDGGLMIFDDVGLEMDGDEMNVFWDAIPERKVRVDHLHPNTGFGIVEKSALTLHESDRAVIAARAHDEIQRRRKKR